MANPVRDTLDAVRAEYPDKLEDRHRALILNRVAYAHRDEGWGVSGKNHGRNIENLDGTYIAEDILHHKPSGTLVDVLQGGTDKTQWIVVGKATDPNRPWVAPINVEGNEPGEPPIPPQQDEDLRELVKSLAGVVTAQTGALVGLREVVLELQRKVDAQQFVLDPGTKQDIVDIYRMTADIKAVATSVPQTPPVYTGTAKLFGQKVNFRLVPEEK